MKKNNEFYDKIEDETGEEYYCPVDNGANNRSGSRLDLDDCVEASTVGRYSGNINVVDRFAS